ncbi:hypothetical protein [Bacillus sp. OV322]|uniref:hypothetical protein n=1 Tax=Bacillus sp. OV322 TaxID=1882764 RepID=UPI00114D43B5|nr:hypothetical protein [Bacillus sp. OV322]
MFLLRLLVLYLLLLLLYQIHSELLPLHGPSALDNQAEELPFVVSDLTYVRVNGKWQYICVFIALFNHEIIGSCTGGVKFDLGLPGFIVYHLISFQYVMLRGF